MKQGGSKDDTQDQLQNLAVVSVFGACNGSELLQLQPPSPPRGGVLEKSLLFGKGGGAAQGSGVSLFQVQPPRFLSESFCPSAVPDSAELGGAVTV